MGYQFLPFPVLNTHPSGHLSHVEPFIWVQGFCIHKVWSYDNKLEAHNLLRTCLRGLFKMLRSYLCYLCSQIFTRLKSENSFIPAHLPLIGYYTNPSSSPRPCQPNKVLTANVTGKKTGSNLQVKE